jgi:hypothetical protein
MRAVTHAPLGQNPDPLREDASRPAHHRQPLGSRPRATQLAKRSFAGEASATRPAAAELTREQRDFMKWRLGMFIHFDLATLATRNFAGGYEDPVLFNPAKLDCGQWAECELSARRASRPRRPVLRTPAPAVARGRKPAEAGRPWQVAEVAPGPLHARTIWSRQ